MERGSIKLGTTVGPWERVVDAGHARAFAMATNDPNPAYLEHGVAPPVFTVAFGLDLIRQYADTLIPPGSIAHAHGVVHGTHDLRLYGPVMAGDRLTYDAQIHSTHQTRAGCIVSQHLTFKNDLGLPVVEHYWNLLYLGGQVTPEGPALAKHAFAEQTREHVLGELTVATTDDQTFRYAGVSSDHAMIHMDDEAAQELGFPSKFLQGLCTLAICSQAVVRLAAQGDPRTLRRLAARFSSPVFPSNSVQVRLYDAGTTVDGLRARSFEAFSCGAAVIRNGYAELAPDEPTAGRGVRAPTDLVA